VSSLVVEILVNLGDQAIPALRQRLTNSAPATQSQILYVLAQMGRDARAALPEMVHVLETGDDDIRLRAGRVLQWIDTESAQKAGVKLKNPGESKNIVTSFEELDVVIPSRGTSAPPRGVPGSP
jgi:HEAT repeat protein